MPREPQYEWQHGRVEDDAGRRHGRSGGGEVREPVPAALARHGLNTEWLEQKRRENVERMQKFERIEAAAEEAPEEKVVSEEPAAPEGESEE